MIHHSSRGTLIPYTTLFRSAMLRFGRRELHAQARECGRRFGRDLAAGLQLERTVTAPQYDTCREVRSEEHTSELQSRRDFVCRLLLEKKNQRTRSQSPMRLR